MTAEIRMQSCENSPGSADLWETPVHRLDHSFKCSSFNGCLILTKIKVLSKLGKAQVMRFQASETGQEEAKANWILLDNPRITWHC